MRQASLIAILVAFAAPAVHAQSLGDVAREQRQKEQVKAGQAAPTVITNEDLPAHSESSSRPSGQPSTLPISAYNAKKTAGQWKSEILRQKNSIASLQNQIANLKSSVRFSRSNCWSCGNYNQRQVNKLDEANRLEDQLSQEKSKLQEMQEGARQDGYGGTVTDP